MLPRTENDGALGSPGSPLPSAADGETVLFEYRMRHADGEWRWLLSRDAPFTRDADGRLRTIVGSTADITEQKRTEAALRAHEERQELLIRELGHRMKNTLATVQAVGFQLHLAAASPAEFYSSFGARLGALAAAHDVLTRDDWQSASLRHLVRESLAPYAPAEEGRVHVEGPPVRVAADRALTLSMAFHELATNAVKHGALSRPGGCVTVVWQARDGGGADPAGIELTWREQGAPAPAPPVRRGFGSQLLERVVTRELGGTLDCDYGPDGLTWRMWLPVSASLALG